MPAGEPLVLTNRHTGERLSIARVRRGSDEWLELKGTLPAKRGGPPLHIHMLEDEDGHIVSGTLSAVVDGKQLTLGPGTSARFPHGSKHRWWNGGDTELVFEGTVKPVVDLDRYLQAVFEVLNAGSAGRPPLFYMAHVSLRHRRTQAVLIMPLALQNVVFRLAVGLGTLLGKYRGTNWPGCPARCQGAPARIEAAVERSFPQSSVGFSM